jgi:hypothetical protein
MKTFSIIINTSNPEEDLKKLDEMVNQASVVSVDKGGCYGVVKIARKITVICDTVVARCHFDEILLIRGVEFEKI